MVVGVPLHVIALQFSIDCLLEVIKFFNLSMHNLPFHCSSNRTWTLLRRFGAENESQQKKEGSKGEVATFRHLQCSLPLAPGGTGTELP